MSYDWDHFDHNYPEKFEKEGSWIKKPCRDRDHNPPGYICIPPGQTHIHRCPSCGKTTIMRGSDVTWMDSKNDNILNDGHTVTC